MRSDLIYTLTGVDSQMEMDWRNEISPETRSLDFSLRKLLGVGDEFRIGAGAQFI